MKYGPVEARQKEKRHNLLKELSDAKTLEEVFLLFLKIRSFSHNLATESVAAIEERKKAIRDEELLSHREEVLECFYSLKEEDKNPLEKTACTLSLPVWKVVEILLLEENEISSAIKKTCDLSFYQKEKRKSEGVEDAKVILSLFMKSSASTMTEFCEKTGCPSSFISYASSMVEKEDKEFYQIYRAFKESLDKQSVLKQQKSYALYLEYEREKGKEQLLKMTKEEFIAFTQKGRWAAYTAFCEDLGISKGILNIYLQEQGENFDDFLSLEKEEKRACLFAYQEELKKRIMIPISSMYQILKIESYNKKNKNQPLSVPTFDLLSFYQEGYTTKLLYNAITAMRLDNAKNVYNIFTKRHHMMFQELKNSEIEGYYQYGQMSLEGNCVFFSRSEFERAITKMKEQNLPLSRGVLFQSLKREKVLAKKRK